jgi:GNAT superfamily N-acetyltransferase
MLRFKEELFEDIQEEVMPLLKQHWEELANHKDIRPFEPDCDSYVNLNRLGVVRICTLRDGYASFIVSNHLHYKSWKLAVCDVYYLHPDYRKTGEAVSMFKSIEDWLKGMGARSVAIQDKVNHSHQKLFLNLGYTITEQLYERIL